MIWCIGMYASGSTWVYNAALQVVAAVLPDRPAIGRYVTCHQDLDLDLPADPHAVRIVKSHDTDDVAAVELERRADAVVLSIRDPRDCVTSLMLYQGYRFPAALAAVERTARFGARFAAHRKATLLRYEAGFIDDVATLDAASLGSRLAETDRARIFDATRRAPIEAFIARLDTLPTALRQAPSGDVVDTATQWHRHHANRSGEIGRWRHMLLLSEAAIVEQRLQDWMAAFCYRPEVSPYIRTVGMETLQL